MKDTPDHRRPSFSRPHPGGAEPLSERSAGDPAGPETSLLAAKDCRLLERLPALVFELDASGTILFTNDAVEASTGYSPAEMVGLNWWEVFFPREFSRRAKRLRETLASGDVLGEELSLLGRSGAPIAIRINTVSDYGVSGKPARVVILATDVTPLRQAQELWKQGKYTLERRIRERTAALAEAMESLEARAQEAEEGRRERGRLLAELNSTFDAIADGVMIFGPAGEILRLNPAAQALIGYGPEELGLPLKERAKRIRQMTAEGRVLPVEEWPLWQALAGETVRGQVLVIERASRRTWCSVSAAPLRTPEGERLGAVVSFTDISPLKELQERHEMHLHTISHDLRIPLTILSGHAQLLQEAAACYGVEKEMGGSLGAILQGAERMSILIQDLVDAARLAGGTLSLQRQALDPGRFVQELLRQAEMAIDIGRVALAAPLQLPPVPADPARLERILLNLLSNALKYSPADSPVQIHLKTGEQEIIFSVTDLGRGIAENDLPHIFDRFYKGTGLRQADSVGLGLFITRVMVEAHGGRIWAKSRLGQGSTFSFSLPLSLP